MICMDRDGGVRKRMSIFTYTLLTEDWIPSMIICMDNLSTSIHIDEVVRASMVQGSLSVPIGQYLRFTLNLVQFSNCSGYDLNWLNITICERPQLSMFTQPSSGNDTKRFMNLIKQESDSL